MASSGMLYNMQRKISCKATMCQKWNIPQITSCRELPQLKYAVLILNRPVTQSYEFMTYFWNNATVRITIDGGTVQWDEYASRLSSGAQKTLKMPDLITGDFDSITEEILLKYRNKGCKAVRTSHQDYTDFTKALIELRSYCEINKIQIDHVIAIGQSSGRLDQILGNIQTLYLAKDKGLLPSSTKLYIMSDDALSWLLLPGLHVITVPEDSITHKGAWCSLVPVAETCESVTSYGLKWDLDDQPLKFGDVVSTSNTFSGSKEVLIKCSHTLLWSMRIPHLAESKK